MGSSTCAQSITRVTFGTIDNASTASLNTNGITCYSDYLSIATNLQTGSTVPMTVHVNGGGPTISVIAWIDWNHSYVLSNLTTAGERYILTTVDDGLTYTGAISVPASATVGGTRLRICATPLANATSCSFGQSGEVEDYTVQVTAAMGACCDPNGDCTATFASTCVAPSVFADSACGPTCCARSSECTNSIYMTSVSLTTAFQSSFPVIIGNPDFQHPLGCYNDLQSMPGASPLRIVCPKTDYGLVVGTTSADSQYQAAAWVDWNHNGVFTDPGESFPLHREGQSGNDPNAFFGTIKVPANPSYGATTMRIRVTGPGPLSPCGVSSAGRTDDWKLQVGETLGICCGETGCCTCVFPDGHSTPENCVSPNVYLACATSCSPNPCPKPPTLYAILAGGTGPLLADPRHNTNLIRTALARFDGVGEDNIHMADTPGQIATAKNRILSKIKPQDTLFFYMMGHGGFCVPGEANCANRIGLAPIPLGAEEANHFPPGTQNVGVNYVKFPAENLYADDLAVLLRSVSSAAHCRIIVVIEACFSGSFTRPGSAWAGISNTAFVFSSDGGHFSVVTGSPSASDHHGSLTLALASALNQGPPDGPMPPFDDIVAAVRGSYQCSAGPCDLAIPAPSADQVIIVTSPTLSLVEDATPDFDGSTAMTSSVPWCGPSLLTEPADTRACPGQPSTFAVTHDPAAYTYQWRRNQLPLADDPGHIAGATAATLVITGATSADAGAYDCIVSNSCADLTTYSAVLTVCIPDFDCNGLVAVADIFTYLNVWFSGSVAADVNGNGLAVSDIFTFFNMWFAGCA